MRRSKQNGIKNVLTQAAKLRRESQQLVSQSRELRKESEQLVEEMLKAQTRRGLR